MMISQLLVLTFILSSMEAHADVAWDSPAAGDVYVPGDTIQVVWTSEHSLSSPSFNICAAADTTTGTTEATDCGTAVWPSVYQNGTEYSISLAVPNITGAGDYHLVMKDDQGMKYNTPDFSLASNKIGVANNTANDNITSTLNPTRPVDTSITNIQSHQAPTVVAIAVPLSLVAATLLVALVLLICRMRRSKQRDKEETSRASEKLGSYTSGISFASAADLERAVLALAALKGYGGVGQQYGRQQPPYGVNVPATMDANLGAAAPPGTFAWTHGFLPVPPAWPAVPEADTTLPIPPYAGVAFPPQQPFAAAPSSAGQSRREIANNDEPARTYSQPSACMPPHLPEIHLHTSSPPTQIHDSVPPPPPPKQLSPGASPGPTQCSYDLPFSSPSPQLSQNMTTSPRQDTYTSLSRNSDYTQHFPTQGVSYLRPPAPKHSQALRSPPSSITRGLTLRRLEVIPENEKHFSTRPEDRIGTELYEAVSRAVRR